MGIKIIRDKSLDKLFGKVLFHEEVEECNKIVHANKWETISL